MPPKWQSTSSSSLLLLHKQKPVILEYPWRAPPCIRRGRQILTQIRGYFEYFLFLKIRTQVTLSWYETDHFGSWHWIWLSMIKELKDGVGRMFFLHHEILGGPGWDFYKILLTSQRDELQSKIAGAAASSQRQPKARPPEVGGLVWREQTSREFTSTWLVSNPFNPLQSWGKFFEPAASFCNPFDFWHMLIKRVSPSAAYCKSGRSNVNSGFFSEAVSRLALVGKD